MSSKLIGLVVLVAGFAIVRPSIAGGGDLQSLAGPRGSRWGDSPEKVRKVEGRDPAVSLDTCLSFRDAEIDGRKYEISYQCFEKGSGFGSTEGWTQTRKAIATMKISLQPFGPPRSESDEFAWWEKELTGKYGEPGMHLEAPASDDAMIVWPHWCPPDLDNPMTWTSGDCAQPNRFTKYRRWTGKKTVIELYDVGARGMVTQGNHLVDVVFSERALFDTVEKARDRATKAALKKQADQKASQARVPAF